MIPSRQRLSALLPGVLIGLGTCLAARAAERDVPGGLEQVPEPATGLLGILGLLLILFRRGRR